MKPVFIVGEMGRGGQERQLRYLLNEIRKKDQSCALVIWEPSEAYLKDVRELESIGISVLRHSESSIMKKLRNTRSFIKEQEGTLLQSFSFYLNFYAGILGILCGIPAIGAIRNRLFITYESDGGIRFFLSSVLPRLKISNNRLYQKGLSFPFLKLLYRRTQVVTNQLDMTPNSYLRKTPSDIIQTCSIGRLYPEKDLFLMVDAISRMIADGNSIQHKHAGKGPLLEELKSYVSSKGIEDYFNFVGELEDINEFLASSDLFLHSSRAEGYPNVIMEAMANGKPILTTRCGDAEDLVINDLNGFSVPVGDIDQYTEKLIYLVRNADKLEEFGRNSFKLAKEKFAIENLLLDTYAAYEKFGIR